MRRARHCASISSFSCRARLSCDVAILVMSYSFQIYLEQVSLDSLVISPSHNWGFSLWYCLQRSVVSSLPLCDLRQLQVFRQKDFSFLWRLVLVTAARQVYVKWWFTWQNHHLVPVFHIGSWTVSGTIWSWLAVHRILLGKESMNRVDFCTILPSVAAILDLLASLKHLKSKMIFIL